MDEDGGMRMVMGQKEDKDVRRGLLIKDNNGKLITVLMQCCQYGEAILNNC